MKKIYISGPISGFPLDEVERTFGEAEKILKEQGYEVVNPLKNGLPVTASWEEHMTADIKMLLDCDAMFILDKWYLSRGCDLELRIANELGIKKIYQTP